MIQAGGGEFKKLIKEVGREHHLDVLKYTTGKPNLLYIVSQNLQIYCML